MPAQAIYDSTFFRKQVAGVKSATVIGRHLMDLFSPGSVVDVGCGVGTWLKVFREMGVERILGIDGDWVDRSLLQIPHESFRIRDLERPFTCSESFDIAMSLEVAEHLAPEAASQFVESLTGLSGTIVFSAAIPHQGGTGHVNERWPSFWASEFARCGFVACDWIRPLIWNNDEVAWCYAQNIVVFVSSSVLSKREQQVRGKVGTLFAGLDVVHPRNYLAKVDAVTSFRQRRIATRICRRLSRFFGIKNNLMD